MNQINKDVTILLEYIDILKNINLTKTTIESFYPNNITNNKTNFIKIIIDNLTLYRELKSFFIIDYSIIIPDLFNLLDIIVLKIDSNNIYISKYEKLLNMEMFSQIQSLLNNKDVIINKSNKKTKKKPHHYITKLKNELKVDIIDTLYTILDNITDSEELLNLTYINTPYSKRIINNFSISSKYKFILTAFFEKLPEFVNHNYIEIISNNKFNISFITLDFFNLLKTIEINLIINPSNIKLTIKEHQEIDITDINEYFKRRNIHLNLKKSNIICWGANHPFGENCKNAGLWGIDRSYCWEHYFICYSSLWTNKANVDPYHDINSCDRMENIDIDFEKKFNYISIKKNIFYWEYQLFLDIQKINYRNLGSYFNFLTKGGQTIYLFLSKFSNKNSYLSNIKSMIIKFIQYYGNINTIRNWTKNNKYLDLIDVKLSNINIDFYQDSILYFKENQKFQHKKIFLNRSYKKDSKQIIITPCISNIEFSKYIKDNSKIQFHIDKLFRCVNDRTLFSNICHRKKSNYKYNTINKGNIDELPHLQHIVYILFILYNLIILIKPTITIHKFTQYEKDWNELINDAIEPYLSASYSST